MTRPDHRFIKPREREDLKTRYEFEGRVIYHAGGWEASSLMDVATEEDIVDAIARRLRLAHREQAAVRIVVDWLSR